MKKMKNMKNIIRSGFQSHPYHLVSPSIWPFYTSVSLLVLTLSGVLTMHGFNNMLPLLIIAFFKLNIFYVILI